MNKKEILERNARKAGKGNKPEKKDEPVVVEPLEPVVEEDVPRPPAKLANVKLTRSSRKEQPEYPEKPPPPVSSGDVGKIMDFMFNPSRDSIRTVTIIDRMQGQLLPQLDLANSVYHYLIEVATYRMNCDLYAEQYKQIRPKQPDIIDDFVFRTAQWQKSVGGVNLNKGVEVVLADMESRASDDPYNIRPDSSE